MTDNKFKLGELVKLVGIIQSISIQSEEVIYYTIAVEGYLPPIPSTCFINEKAVRQCNEEDLEFFKSREPKL